MTTLPDKEGDWCSLDEAVRLGILVRIEPDLYPNECQERLVYLTPEAREELEKMRPPPSKGRGKGAVKAFYAVNAFFRRFVKGERLFDPVQIEMLVDGENKVWVLRPMDRRLFGFFLNEHVFVGVWWQNKGKLQNDFYTASINRVLQFIESNKLDAFMGRPSYVKRTQQ